MTPINRLVPWLIAALVIIFDLMTKLLIVGSMDLHQSIPVLGDAVRLTYIHNDGLAFGIDTPLGRWHGVFSLVASIIIIILLIRLKSEPTLHRLLLGVIMGGAIGNTIDRLLYGYVIDFIDVDLPDWLMERWPVFNVADSAVSVGVTLLLIVMLFKPSQAKQENASDDKSHSEQSEELT